MAFQDPSEIPRGTRRESPGIFEHIEGDIGQFEESPHLAFGQGLVAEHAFPAVRGQARGERAGENLAAADARRIHPEDGDHPSGRLRALHNQAGIGVDAERGRRTPTRSTSGFPLACRRA